MTKFQGSQTSRVQITAYSFGDEPGLSQTARTISFYGPGDRTGAPTVVRCATQKALGPATGSFMFEVKADRAGREAVAALSDDDWVDLVFSNHDVPVHVMRGQIDDIRLVTSVVNGATSNVIRITGRDFGRIFDITPLWFDIVTDGSAISGAMARILDANVAFFGNPAITTHALLVGFLQELRKLDRAQWELPPTMPMINGLSVGATDEVNSDLLGGVFTRNVTFFSREFTNYPERHQPIAPSLFTASDQRIWALAMQWADLPLCECYTELLESFVEGGGTVTVEREYPQFGVPENNINYPRPFNAPIQVGSALTPDLTVMSVIFRDRPFPTTTRAVFDKSGRATAEPFDEGPWFKKLQTFEVRPEHVERSDVGRSGVDRKNAFYAAPRLFHELVGGYFDLNGPLWSPSDIRRHGFRRHDVLFDYYTRDGQRTGLYELTQIYKTRLRDFHCMNHLLLNGSIQLGHGRPDMRIGQKLRISNGSQDTQETYYIEAVNNTWSLVPGTRTSATVTRGWRGSDQSFVDAFFSIIGRYKQPKIDGAGDEPVALSRR